MDKKTDLINRKTFISGSEYIFFATAIALILVVCFSVTECHAQKKRMHTVYFDGTDHELHVYRIYGEEHGKTLMLIGGIQGDEPGGFISADHYADFSLAKGNLIVVPRANFRSILLKRRKVNEDMNRRFADSVKVSYEDKIVEILKKLITESDCLLNLHDGSGFFSEKWESPMRNPKRYGQSLIADIAEYTDEKTGKTLNLKEMAEQVSVEINKSIRNEKHHFRFNNHRTSDTETLHKEQRKSATYYALFSCGIPAFGVETSKTLPLETKVRHHNLAINAFMKLFDILPETPGIRLDEPRLNYVIVSVNDSMPIVVKNQQTLHVNPGDRIYISHLESNYERGLTADVRGVGTINDVRKPIEVMKPTRIVVRKDYYPCGTIYVDFGDTSKLYAKNIAISDKKPKQPSVSTFKIKVNGEERLVENNRNIKLTRGDTIQIMDVNTDTGMNDGLVVNFKGYVGDRGNNTGEDRGYVIRTDQDLWKRYSLNRDGKKYQVVVKYGEAIVGNLYVELNEPV